MNRYELISAGSGVVAGYGGGIQGRLKSGTPLRRAREWTPKPPIHSTAREGEALRSPRASDAQQLWRRQSGGKGR